MLVGLECLPAGSQVLGGRVVRLTRLGLGGGLLLAVVGAVRLLAVRGLLLIPTVRLLLELLGLLRLLSGLGRLASRPDRRRAGLLLLLRAGRGEALLLLLGLLGLLLVRLGLVRSVTVLSLEGAVARGLLVLLGVVVG